MALNAIWAKLESKTGEIDLQIGRNWSAISPNLFFIYLSIK